jgi:hypothetical protein
MYASGGPPPGPKKTSKTLVIVLSILGAFVMLGALVVIVAIVAFARSDTGKKTIDIMKEAREAQNAPGTRELRKLGCEQASAMDMDRFGRLLNDDAALKDDEEDEDAAFRRTSQMYRVMVSCQGGFLRTPPSCDDVAQTYVDAVGTVPGPFIVSVTNPKDPMHPCNGEYSADGTRLPPRRYRDGG